MSILPVVISIAAVLLSLVVALFVITFVLAAGANSSPAQILELKVACWTILATTILSVGAMIWLLVVKRPWWSLGAASTPGAMAILVLLVLIVRSQRSAASAPDGFTTSQRSHAPKEHAMARKADAYAARTKEARQQFLERVESMEEANELKAMEEAIMAHDNSLWSCCHIAELYRRRMHRLKAAGDVAGAEAAFARSYHWMCSFASGATSGGEGAANSLARDEHLERLVGELGYMPASVTPWNA